jgi:heterodisulfide reductase subunit B
VTACPLCQGNLDLRREDIEKREQVSLDLPVFYFTELLGIALGKDAGDLGLGKHMVNPLPVLSGILSGAVK